MIIKQIKEMKNNVHFAIGKEIIILPVDFFMVKGITNNSELADAPDAMPTTFQGQVRLVTAHTIILDVCNISYGTISNKNF